MLGHEQLPCAGLSNGVGPHGARTFGVNEPVFPMPPKPILSKSIPRSLGSLWKKPITSISKVKNVIAPSLRFGKYEGSHVKDTRCLRPAARRRASLYRSSGKVWPISLLRAAAKFQVPKKDGVSPLGANIL